MPKASKEFGKRTEMKNISSFSATQHAIDTEIRRQIDVVTHGGEINQETSAAKSEVSGIVQRMPMLPASACKSSTRIISLLKRTRAKTL